MSDETSTEDTQPTEPVTDETEEAEETKTEEVQKDESGLSVEDVTKQALAGKWNTGRERDDRLRAAGYDPAEVQREMAKQLSEQSSET